MSYSRTKQVSPVRLEPSISSPVWLQHLTSRQQLKKSENKSDRAFRTGYHNSLCGISYMISIFLELDLCFVYFVIMLYFIHVPLSLKHWTNLYINAAQLMKTNSTSSEICS